MALWKNEPESAPASSTPPTRKPEVSMPTSATPEQPRRSAGTGESLIASGLIIEGKIEGAGHVRIAGQFNGDVHVDGNLTIEAGAKLTGGVRADRVSVGGELEGNIEAASAVELTSTGVLNGDLKAGSLTVAAGSRMRGKVEFGWNERSASTKQPAATSSHTPSHTASAAKSSSASSA